MSEESLVTTTLTLQNKLGLHTRPATLIVKLLQNYDSRVFFTHLGEKIDARSVLNLLTLAAKQGEELFVEVEGDDAHEVVSQLEELFENRFDES